MFKALAKIEHKIGDKVYQFICDGDSPIEQVKECLFQFTKYVAQVEDQMKAHQAAQVPPAPQEPVVNTETKTE